MKAFKKTRTEIDATFGITIGAGDGLVASEDTDVVAVDAVFYIRGEGPAVQRLSVSISRTNPASVGATVLVDVPPGRIVAAPLSALFLPGEDNELQYEVTVEATELPGPQITLMPGSFIRVTWPYEAP